MNKLFGGLFFAVGILIMTGSGLCSLTIIISGLTSLSPDTLAMAWLPLVFGGIPFVIGFLLFRWGRSLLRIARAEQEGQPDL